MPMQNSDKLKAESQEQGHCVVSCHADIVAGLYYVYKALIPECATLGIKISQTSKANISCRIDQLKGFRNKAVSEEKMLAISKCFSTDGT